MMSRSLALNWYGKALPNSNDLRAIHRFITRSKALIENITPARVRIVDGQTGYTDGKEICLPSLYITKQFVNEMRTRHDFLLSFSDSEIIATAYNGTMTHEAFHCAYTDFDFLKRHIDKEYLSLRGNNIPIRSFLFNLIRNVVEDVYIESKGRSEFSIESQFATEKNKLFFPQFFVEDCLNKKDIPTAFIGMKNTLNWPHFQDHEILGEALQLLATTSYYISPEFRFILAFKIYEILKQEDEKADSNYDYSSSDPFEEEMEFEGALPKPDYMSSKKVDALLDIEKEYAEEELRKSEIKAEKSRSKSTPQLKEEVEQLEGEFSDFSARIEIEDVKSASKMFCENDIEFLTEFKRFASEFLYLTEEKHTPGRPRTTGSKLIKNRLSRIATDHKILAELDSKRLKRGKPEVIILVDGSGSMGGLYYRVLNAAYSSFKTLNMARIPCSVFAHTTRSPYGDVDTWDSRAYNPYILAIASYDMPFTSPGKIRSTSHNLERFKKATGLSKQENVDGFIVQHLLNFFTNRPGDKIFIVLSDGAPSCPGYHGDRASIHTHHVAELARKKGIGVMSISLVPTVIYQNNEIYGVEYNVDGTNGKFQKELKSVISKLTNL